MHLFVVVGEERSANPCPNYPAAAGSLAAAVEHVYPLDQFKEAFEHSLRSSRTGKIIFKFGAIGQR